MDLGALDSGGSPQNPLGKSQVVGNQSAPLVVELLRHEKRETEMNVMEEAEVTETPENPERGSWVEHGMTFLAIVGLLTIVIGGAVVIRNGLSDERPERIIRVVEPEPDRSEQVCYEEVVRSGGGLFGDLDDDDFDAEAQFARDGERRVVIVCEDW